MRVLLVEDQPEILEMLTVALQTAGHYVTACADYESGHAHIVRHPFDALVADVRLGAFNGLGIALAARQRDPGIRIVVISGFDDVVLQADAASVGAAYMVKPLEIGGLLAALSSGRESS